MTKKNKSKTSPEIVQEETDTEEEEKPSTKKPGNEIDESELEKTEKDATAKPNKVKKKKKDTSKVHDNDDGGFGDSSSKLRKKSVDGITINTGAGGLTTTKKPQYDSTSSMEKPQADTTSSSEKSKDAGGMMKIVKLDYAQKLAEKWVSEMSPIPDDKDDYVDWGKIIANSPRLCAIGDRVFGNLDPPLFGYESDDAKKPPATDPKK
ncbi:hypothetical protein TIFTF001_023517 [Ficus carica]|uniref:Uncharacterized protein n=1 Tax=Ficus carica TaxID=3494 RepID=A0AA88AEW8_FICCA|nr:hypothetical protein TIFTF001_023517 [Ficus carica]